MAGAFKWEERPRAEALMARKFYGITAVSTPSASRLASRPPIRTRRSYWSAVINGVISVPRIMAVMMLMAVRPEIMGTLVITRKLRVLGWLATGMMGFRVVVTMFWTVFKP
jgi:Mn2+/Fe2+ NRAMP family transporter